MKILTIEMKQTVREHLCRNNCIKCISHIDDNDNITYRCSLYMRINYVERLNLVNIERERGKQYENRLTS